MKPDQSIIPDCGSIADRAEDRLGRLEEERGDLVAPGRVDPRHEHPTEDERPQRHQDELDEVEEEGPGTIRSLPALAQPPAPA